MTFKILLTIQTVNTIDWIFKIKQMKNCWAHSWIVCAKTVQEMSLRILGLATTSSQLLPESWLAT